MDRRSLLLQAFSLAGAVSVAPAALRGSVRSGTSLQEAVDTGDPLEVVTFVEENPRLTGHSPLRVRLAALELLEGDAARQFRERYINAQERAGTAESGASASAGAAALEGIAPPADFGSAECRSRQRAAGIILRESTEEDLVWIAGQGGGPDAVHAYLTLRLQEDMRKEMTRMRDVLERV